MGRGKGEGDETKSHLIIGLFITKKRLYLAGYLLKGMGLLFSFFCFTQDCS
jgi:hypothetical protein